MALAVSENNRRSDAIDRRRTEIIIDGAPVLLTAMEWKLLERLTQVPGECVSKQVLHAHVYGGSDRSASDVSTAIRAAISRRRRHSPVNIETRSGRGYTVIGLERVTDDITSGSNGSSRTLAFHSSNVIAAAPQERSTSLNHTSVLEIGASAAQESKDLRRRSPKQRSQSITVDGRPILLTAMEWKLLDRLTQVPEGLVCKRALQAYLYGDIEWAAGGKLTAIRVAISSLRRLLPIRIEAKFGHGYILSGLKRVTKRLPDIARNSNRSEGRSNNHLMLKADMTGLEKLVVLKNFS